MSKGFIYNIDRCVACHACISACILENGAELQWRQVRSTSPGTAPDLPVHNVSMACNHCTGAPCVEGCPTGACHFDPHSGAVVIDDAACIGCNYCSWNCPFDAPKLNSRTGVIEKCHLCTHRVEEGLHPACVTSCPTGALSFGEPDNSGHSLLRSSIDIGERLMVKGTPAASGRPEMAGEQNEEEKGKSAFRLIGFSAGEWALVVFTWLSSLMFAFNVSNRFGLFQTSIYSWLALLMILPLVPLFHLRKPFRGYLAVRRLFRSPLSNEIAALLVFVISSAVSALTGSPHFWVVSFVSGLVLLITVDSVYIFTDRRREIRYHYSQLFLSGLTIASLLLGAALPLVFVVVIRLVAMAYLLTGRRSPGEVLIMLTIALILIFAALSLIFGFTGLILPLVLLAAAEFAGRVRFYSDFRPENLLPGFSFNILSAYEKREGTQ